VPIGDGDRGTYPGVESQAKNELQDLLSSRSGHSVETLVSTYVGALDGDEAVANRRIDAVLGSKTVGLRVPGSRHGI
jgi:hypothetical protein